MDDINAAFEKLIPGMLAEYDQQVEFEKRMKPIVLKALRGEDVDKDLDEAGIIKRKES